MRLWIFLGFVALSRCRCAYLTGMQMWLSFAVYTVVAPDIMVMNEWLAVGDDEFREKAGKRLTAVVEDW